MALGTRQGPQHESDSEPRFTVEVLRMDMAFKRDLVRGGDVNSVCDLIVSLSPFRGFHRASNDRTPGVPIQLVGVSERTATS